MTDTHRLLVLGPDAGLVTELRAAAGSLDELRISVEYKADPASGISRAADRGYGLAVLDDRMGEEQLSQVARNLRESGFGGQAIVAFRPDVDGLAEGSPVWLELVRNDVRDFLRRPVSSADLERVLQSTSGVAQAQPAAQNASSGRVVLISSSKGGVGKSTLAVNLAVELARRAPENVLLIDASLQIGTCASLLDVDTEVCLTDVVRERERLDATLLRSLARVHASGLHVLPAPRDAVEATEIDEAAFARALSVARRAYEWVVIDTFPMLDDVTMAALDLCDRVFVVTSGSVPTVRGVGSYLELLTRLGVSSDRIRIIWNRSRPGFSGSLSAKDLASTLGRPADQVVPFSKSFLVGADQGEPPAFSAGRFSRARRAIERIAKQLRADFKPGEAE